MLNFLGCIAITFFSRESRTKPLFATGILDGGVDPTYHHLPLLVNGLLAGSDLTSWLQRIIRGRLYHLKIVYLPFLS